jgi:hypothetical protein
MGPYPIKTMLPKIQMGKDLAVKYDDAFLKVNKRFKYLEIKNNYIDGLK